MISRTGLLLLFLVFPAGSGPLFTLNILHVNDTHSHLLPVTLQIRTECASESVRIPAGGSARLARAVQLSRSEGENTLFLHAGDMVQGTLFYTVYGGRADAAVLNAMGLDAMVPGNHEFDRGSSGLALLLDEAGFPMVCANLDLGADTLLAGRIAPFTVLEAGGERIGVIGLVTEELHSVSSPSRETLVLPLKEAAENAVDILSRQGVNKIIVLSHIGYALDLELASEISGVDVIVGGHSHTLLGDFSGLGLASGGDYPTVVSNPDGDPVLVVTAWRHGLVLGRLLVEFDDEGRVMGWEGSPVILTSEDTPGAPGLFPVGEDPLVAEVVDAYASALDDFARELVATAESDLYHARIPGGELSGGSMIAPVVCDAMLWKMNGIGIGADIALQNAGGVRIDIPAGDVTVGTVYSLLPFGNTLAVMDLTGEEVYRLLEDALSGIFDDGRSDGGFPYVSGIRYRANRSGPPGERVYAIEVVTPSGHEPLEPSLTYRMVTNAFVAGGGDCYGFLAGIPSTDTGFVDAEVFTDYLRSMGVLSPVDQRVFLRE